MSEQLHLDAQELGQELLEIVSNSEDQRADFTASTLGMHAIDYVLTRLGYDRQGNTQ